MRRIGVLMMYAERDGQAQALVAVFREGLRQLGWMEDHNIRLDYRWATSELGDDTAVREGTRRPATRPDFSSSTPTTVLLLQQTRTIPIVFATLSIRSAGLGRELAETGWQCHGFPQFRSLDDREVARAAEGDCTGVARVAIFFNPSTAPYAQIFLNLQTAAASLRMEASLHVFAT